MTAFVLVIAAVLGQTTPSANPRAARPPGRRMTVASRPAQPAPSAARPPAVAAPPRAVVPGVRPGEAAPRTNPLPATVGLPATMPAGLPASMPASMPAGQDLAAQVAALGSLTGARVQVEVTQTGDIVLIGDPQDVAILQALIKQMEDQPGMVPDFKVITLKNSQAATLATQLQTFWNEAKGKRPGGVRPEDKINIIPEPRANLLMIAASKDNMPQIEKIVSEFDQPLSPDKGPVLFQPIPLQYIKVGEAEAFVRDMLKDLQARRGAQAEPATVRSDPRTNSLLISASQADFEQIKLLVKIIDVPPVAGMASVKFAIFPLKKAAAEQLAKMFNEILSAQPVAGGGSGNQNQAIRDQIRRLQMVFMGPGGGKDLAELDLEKQIRVWPETGTNSIIVATSQENLEPMRAIIEMLDSVPLSDEITVRVYRLQHADPEQLKESLQGMFDKGADLPMQPKRSTPPDRVPPNPEGRALAYRVALAADKRTNMLLAAGRAEQLQLVEQVIDKLDVKDEASQLAPRLIKIEHADVKTVSETLQKLVDQRQKLIEAGGANAARPQTIGLFADQRSSTLIVVANDDNFREIVDLIKQLDVADINLTGGARFFEIKNADAVRVGDALDQLLKGIKATLQDAKQLEYTVVADPRARMVVVSGTRDALKQAEMLVAKLDVAVGLPTGEMHVYTLKQASARQLAGVLTDLFEQRQQGGGGGGGGNSGKQLAHTPVLIQAEDSSNSLIVTASVEEHAVVKDLLNTLDRPSTLAQQMRVFPLAHARADSLGETLDKLLKEQAQSGGRGGSSSSGSGPQVAITPESRTNALIVYAAPDMMTNVEKIIQSLDTTQTVSEMGLQVFKLRNAEAQDLSKRLEEFFKNAVQGGSTGGSGKGGRQMIIHFIARNPATNVDEPRTLVYEDLTITPDPATNSLMVLAPRDSIGMMQHLVEMLDSVELRTADIRVFQLRNADAEDMKKTLEELFKNSGSSGGGNSKERPVLQLASEGGAGGAGQGAPGGIAEIAFSTDQRTNSVIAAGSPSNLRTVADLIEQLDNKDQDERIVKVVHLRYAPAKDVATALKSYFEAESGLIEKAAQGTSEARKTEREVTVQEAGDIQNTLLLSYSQRMEPQVINIVEELDLPPPQVMIQVLMAEVTIDDNLEMGMEFALQDLNFSKHSFTTNGVLQGNGWDKVFGVDLGAQGTSGLGGISFTITGEDFNFLVRALQTEGRLDVLSRPSILVQDSQDANITVGERVPTIQDINISTTGQVTPSVTYEEVGVKLDVTPIINPDGFVNLKIKPEISAIGTSSVTVASGVSLPTFTTRQAETSVTVKDGETIIIGGLITNRENNSENKVPLAGDIPLLGNLFRATVKTTTKTELLMVLTPTVIRDADQARWISTKMRDETGLIDNIRRSPLMSKLQVTPEEEFGPPAPPEHSPARSAEPSGSDEYGPVLEEYGPRASSIRRDESGPDMATFRIRKPTQAVLVPSRK